MNLKELVKFKVVYRTSTNFTSKLSKAINCITSVSPWESLGHVGYGISSFGYVQHWLRTEPHFCIVLVNIKSLLKLKTNPCACLPAGRLNRGRFPFSKTKLHENKSITSYICFSSGIFYLVLPNPLSLKILYLQKLRCTINLIVQQIQFQLLEKDLT